MSEERARNSPTARAQAHTFALRALEALGSPFSGTVELHFTYDEEFGGLLGPGYLLRTGATKPDLASAPASPMPSSRPATAACGSK